MRTRFFLWITWMGAATLLAWPSGFREPTVKTAELAIHADREGCPVELDSAPAGKTDARGNLTLGEIEPGDHYVHIRCPGEDESAYFVSLEAGKKTEVGATKSEAASPESPQSASLGAGEAKIRLRRLVQQGVQARNRGHFDEAISLLREALQLDPDNSDLHCELGITFLLEKEWKSARVEMLEALYHDPSSANAHNGLGYALEKLGDLDGALKEYRLATRLDPDDPTYRTHYFDALSKLTQQKATKK